MGRKKIFAEVNTYTGIKNGDFSKAWISKSLAKDLQIMAKKDWIYLSKDWMGVLSTQALVEDIVDVDGYKVFLSEDRMIDAHFVDGDKPKTWKVTEWE